MARDTYPQIYGRKGSALPDFASPLNIDQEGDSAPQNDMAEIGLADGKSCPDPNGFITPIQGKNGK